MKYNRLDGIEKDWSRITLGCWQLAPSGGWGDICPAKDAEKVVRTALDMESPRLIPQKDMVTENRNAGSAKHWGHKKIT